MSVPKFDRKIPSSTRLQSRHRQLHCLGIARHCLRRGVVEALAKFAGIKVVVAVKLVPHLIDFAEDRDKNSQHFHGPAREYTHFVGAPHFRYEELDKFAGGNAGRIDGQVPNLVEGIGRRSEHRSTPAQIRREACGMNGIGVAKPLRFFAFGEVVVDKVHQHAFVLDRAEKVRCAGDDRFEFSFFDVVEDDAVHFGPDFAFFAAGADGRSFRDMLDVVATDRIDIVKEDKLAFVFDAGSDDIFHEGRPSFLPKLGFVVQADGEVADFAAGDRFGNALFRQQIRRKQVVGLIDLFGIAAHQTDVGGEILE